MANISRYDYTELREKAVETRSPEDVAKLGKWMEQYGGDYWNGECWDIDDGYSLYPIYSDPDEDGDVEVIGYDIR